MATHASITSTPGFAAAMLAEATACAEGKKATVGLLAQALAARMREIHGGSWVCNVDHEDTGPFVLVRMRRDLPIKKPRNGEAA